MFLQIFHVIINMGVMTYAHNHTSHNCPTNSNTEINN